MPDPITLVKPILLPPLDEDFRPAVLANHAFQRQATAEGGLPLVLGLEREAGKLSRYETLVFPPGHRRAAENYYYAERIVRFLLWQRGGHRLYVGGPAEIAAYLAETYSPAGAHSFDCHFMGEQVYERPFSVVACAAGEVPPAHEAGRVLGGHLEGCRIGFDLGASDRKVSAVIDGQAVYSEEVVWEPRKHSDPAYYYGELLAGLRSAASHLPRLDAIGGSSAGIIIDNRPMVASLFRAVPPERYGKIRSLFQRVQAEFNVPLEVLNDGDVTALAGAMSLEDTGVLGVAMGSSEAAGFVDRQGRVLGWLNELSFAPVDFNPAAPADEWSGDLGCGSTYFSQQCVFRLAPRAGIEIPAGLTDAGRLKFVQELLEAGHAGAIKIWQSMGIYFGYGLAHYADYYDLKHVLVLGRCTSGRGGKLILDGARAVLEAEFPALARRLHIQLPDEKSRRVGQSIAAASLPVVGGAHD